MTHETPPQPEPLTASREMTPDELVAKAETFEVIDGAITIPALWPRLILERERAARLPVSGESEEHVLPGAWCRTHATYEDHTIAAALTRSSEARTKPETER